MYSIENIHILVKNTVDGRIRFSKEYDDKAFFELVEKRLGGYFPMDWKAIHIEKSEYMGSDSKRMKLIAEMPVAVSESGSLLDPEDIIIRDSQLTDKERWYEKMATLAKRARVDVESIDRYTEDEIKTVFRKFIEEMTSCPEVQPVQRLRIRKKAKVQTDSEIIPAPGLFYWVFLNPEIMKSMILSDDEQRRIGAMKLHDEGWIPLWGCALSKRQANLYLRAYYPNYVAFEPVKAPTTLREACEFVNDNHRHHISPQGHKFSVALSDGNKIIGVAIIGRPVARWKDDHKTLEVTRLAVKEAYPNLCSMLYRSAARIAKELGYDRLITYTLVEEPGSSLKAAGFEWIGESDGGSWNSNRRKRVDRHPIGRKNIWEIRFG
ncbi:XF1762 family protein [Neobacillus pocheonensis]|uniref:XF1762 family protein n=1 Tax=Neobacillus pocheonensis TaxID=363869 RepID=UPI003D272F25